ncbi:ATP-binding protein [Oerskovia sp. M15]
MRVELDQIDRLLDGLLVLARGQNGVLADREQVSFAELVGRALIARADDVTRMQLQVDLDLGDTTPTEGDRTLLHRVVQNLVDNAVVHNQTGGWIRVTTDADLDTTRLTVESGSSPRCRGGRPAGDAVRADRARTNRVGRRRGPRAVDRRGGGRRAPRSSEPRCPRRGGLRVTVELPVSASGNRAPA